MHQVGGVSMTGEHPEKPAFSLRETMSPFSDPLVCISRHCPSQKAMSKHSSFSSATPLQSVLCPFRDLGSPRPWLHSCPVLPIHRGHASQQSSSSCFILRLPPPLLGWAGCRTPAMTKDLESPFLPMLLAPTG